MDLSCPSCGLAAPDGTPGCKAMFDEILAREWDNPTSYRYHRMFVDTYALQHPDEYCASAKSFAAHLTGMCAAMEHKSHPSALKALQRWLSGTVPITKPEVPLYRGALTIAEVYVQREPVPHALAVDRWARSTWEAYSALHPLARRWIEHAFASK